MSGSFSAPVARPCTLSEMVSLTAWSVNGPAAVGPEDHFIVDLDGTLIRGGEATEGAIAFLAAVEGRYIVVSNNSRDTSRSLSTKLRRAGLDVPGDRIVLAGEETIGFVARQYPGSRCLIASSAQLRHAARRLGLIPVTEQADVVIVGRDTRWSYDKLTLLANEVQRGAILIGTNPDLTHPDANGRVVPETGALLAAVEAAAGRSPARVIGKPETLLFLTALERLGSNRRQTLVIGDNPWTDQAGAFALDLRCLLIDADRRGGLPNLADVETHLRRSTLVALERQDIERAP